MRYGSDIRAEAKRLFVIEERSPQEISDIQGQAGPVPQTIYNWAAEEDEDGNDWWDLRRERQRQLYEDTTPRAMAKKLHQQMHQLLEEQEIDPKKADALAKYTKVLRQVTDPKYQLSMMYEVLSDWVVFLRDNYPDLLDDDLTTALRDFKNKLRREAGL